MSGQPGRSGGARVISGPPKQYDALRRDRDVSTWSRLPAHRTGDPPPWPLPYPKKRELAVWAREWRRGQAVMWETFEWEDQVALYVRQKVRAEQPKATESSRNALRNMEIDLGISAMGLARRQWIIAAEPHTTTTEGETPQPARSVATGPSAKDRLRKRGMGIVGETA